MKKVFLILIIIIIIITNKKENVVVVNSIIDSDNMIEVTIVVPGLNTKNFSNYFDNDVEIIGIYPRINLLYKDRVTVKFYQFSKGTVADNIYDFERYYKMVLKKNNFNSDLVLIDYNGIGIEKVKLYVDNKYLNEFVKKCPNCSYNI